MTREELLLKLRDIEAPPEPAWWLLGPAWLWLTLFITCLFGVAWWWTRRRRGLRLVRLARAELQAIDQGYRQDGDAHRFAYQVSRWLKQVAMLAYPERELQRKSGEAWLRFLDGQLTGRPFSQGCGRVFGERLYRRDIDIDVEQTFALCERWLHRNSSLLRRRSRAS